MTPDGYQLSQPRTAASIALAPPLNPVVHRQFFWRSPKNAEAIALRRLVGQPERVRPVPVEVGRRPAQVRFVEQRESVFVPRLDWPCSKLKNAPGPEASAYPQRAIEP